MEASSVFSLEKERWPAAGETELGMCSRGKEETAWEKEDGGNRGGLEPLIDFFG